VECHGKSPASADRNERSWQNLITTASASKEEDQDEAGFWPLSGLPNFPTNKSRRQLHLPNYSKIDTLISEKGEKHPIFSSIMSKKA
jgi:hypothetical protein